MRNKTSLTAFLAALLAAVWLWMTPFPVHAATCTSNQSGDWNNPAIWNDCGGNYPGQTTNDYVVIANGHTVDLNISPGAIYRLQINSGGTLNANENTLTISAAGDTPGITNNGVFNAGSGTVLFSGSYGWATSTVSGDVNVTFNNVTIRGDGNILGVDFGSNSTVNGILTINDGGFVDTNAPTYGNSSTLRYDAPGYWFGYDQGDEWGDSGGAVPYHVEIVTGTTLGMGNDDRTVQENLTINGALTLSAGGGDLTVGGNFVNNGTFNASDNAVTLTGAGAAISGSSATTFAALTIANGASVFIPEGTEVDYWFVNFGAVSQQRNVTGNEDVTFLALAGYGGVILNNAGGADLGQTTVTIRGNQSCNVGDTLVNRCFDISPTNNSGRNATVTFFWHEDELNGNSCSIMNAYRWNGASWDAALTLDSSYGIDGRDCTPGLQSLRVNGVADFSPFGLSSETPTAVTLQSFTAHTGVARLPVLVAVTLLLGLVGVVRWLRHTNQDR